MNPNTCSICEMAFAKIMKARAVTIDAAVMLRSLWHFFSGRRAITWPLGQVASAS